MTVRRSRSAIPILSLAHLYHLTGAPYPFLRRVIGRRAATGHYRTFAIRKRGARGEDERRPIAVPTPDLLAVQRWLARHVLANAKLHPASRAFAPGCSVLEAARQHCGARWLIMMDVRRFFESISEREVYRVFVALGYQRLVAFELARLCTRSRVRPSGAQAGRWYVGFRPNLPTTAYRTDTVGYLPQGAPTSPMLSNLVARPLDLVIERVATEYGLTYSRYADDLTFSTQRDTFSKSAAGKVVNRVYDALRCHGMSPNTAKTAVIPPGARKVVLGLLVDWEQPRLTRQFRHGLRQHLHYLEHPEHGAVRHAERRGFESVEGLRRHLYGRVAFAGQIGPCYADRCRARLDALKW